MFPLKGFDNDYFFHVKTAEENFPDYLCFTAREPNSTIQLNATGRAPNVSLEVSTDKKSWITFNAGQDIFTLTNVDDKVFFRGNNERFSNSTSRYWSFVMTGKIAASGNIMSIVDSEAKSLTIEKMYCFVCIFAFCTSLITPPVLPATELKENCYQAMFYGCTSLITPPELPAEYVKNYSYNMMFQNCTSLITPPELPATKLGQYSYSKMFCGCTSLASLPDLPAVNLTAINCYDSMFADCTGIELSEIETESYTKPYRIPSAGEGNSSRDALKDMFANTGGTFTGTPEINTTYYLAEGTQS